MEARRLHIARFLNLYFRGKKTFQSIHQHLHETGTLKRRGKPRRLMEIRTVEVSENVLNMMEEDSVTSTKKIALNVSNKTVWKSLRQYLLFPYQIQRTQGLFSSDFLSSIAFCGIGIR